MKTLQKNTFDVIVVGSGMTGGWAAKEFTEKGFHTLVLERGRPIEHIKDYPTTNLAPWEFKFRKALTKETREEYSIQKNVYCFDESTKHFFASDKQHPYTYPDNKPFEWIKGFQVGGKSLIWARQTYRLSEMDFEANLRDGHGVDWPLRYKDIAPWYDYVEKFIGISGKKEGYKQMPDSQFLPPMEMNCIEQYFKESVSKNFNGRAMTIGRCAHLTTHHNGRGPCQYRFMCETGCPYGGYFSSVSATLPAAQATGNMMLRPYSIVHSVIYDSKSGKASGVQVIDSQTKETTEYFARIVFLCASTLPTTQIMLNSKSETFPDGIANSSGTLGHYLMDHLKAGIFASYDGFEDKYYNGHRPNCAIMPRFQNLDGQDSDFLRGYFYQVHGSRENWNRGLNSKGWGKDFKDEIIKPGQWQIYLNGMGECLPYYENKVELHPEKIDEWGIPLLHISGEIKENERKIIHAMLDSGKEMLEKAGFRNIELSNPEDYIFGSNIHEMGTARMGRDPKTSVVNQWNACHDVPNLFITDGSFMASSACQNPSLTYMAFTARAADYAVKEMKNGRL